jgi:hypothetical protein
MLLPINRALENVIMNGFVGTLSRICWNFQFQFILSQAMMIQDLDTPILRGDTVYQFSLSSSRAKSVVDRKTKFAPGKFQPRQQISFNSVISSTT